MLTFNKVGPNSYKSAGGTKIYEIKLNTEKDRYELQIDGELELVGQDEEFPGYFYYLKEAKNYILSLEPGGEKTIEVYVEWIKVQTKEQKGYDVSESDLRIRLNQKADRYEIFQGSKKVADKIYYMSDAKEIVKALLTEQPIPTYRTNK